MSDLHLEIDMACDLPGPADRPDYDILVVAGDLTTRMERGVMWLAARVTHHPVIYISGNHEAYGADIDRTIEKAREAAAGTNVHVMQDDVLVINGVKFIAGTLWTDFALLGDPVAAMAAAHWQMNDYKRIRIHHYKKRLIPIDTLGRHTVSRAFIEDELAKPFAGKTAVITHHAPHRETVNHNDILSSAYASDLSELIEARGPDVWIHGHIHRSDDRIIGRTRILANPKGYTRDLGANLNFDPKLTIEI